MRLKVLVVPFLVIMILVISIGYIKPGMAVLEAQKLERTKKSNQADNIQTVVNNVDALSQSLDNKKELTSFMGRYLPQKMDQGRVIDAFNFLASQSGLVVVDMAMEEPPKIVMSGAESAVDPTTGMVVADPGFKDPVASTYSASVKVRGSYESIKGFFDRVSHMDRFHKVSDLVIQVPTDTGATASDTKQNAAPKTGKDLIGIFEAKFDYFPGRTVQTAVAVPVFGKSEFDFSVPQKALDRVTSPVAELEYVPAGKPNPFQ